MPRAQLLQPDPALVDEVAAMIAEAERPIVIGGRGATWSGAKTALEALAEQSGALLATTLLGKGLFDGNPSRSTSPAYDGVTNFPQFGTEPRTLEQWSRSTPPASRTLAPAISSRSSASPAGMTC